MIVRCCFIVTLSLVTTVSSDVSPPLATALNKTDSLDLLFEDYFQWKLRSYPEWASKKGFKGYNHLLEDFSIESIRHKAEQCREFLERSKNLTAKNSNYRSYQQVFQAEVRPCAEGLQYKAYLFPPVVDNLFESVQKAWPRMVEDTDLDSIRDYEDLLDRISLIPTRLDEIILLLKTGVREGITFARESIDGVDEQLEKLQVDPEESVFYSHFRDMPGSLGRHVVDRIQQSSFNLTKNGILPGFRKLQEFLRYEYSPHLRQSPGVLNIPNGDKFYRAALKSYGVDYDPEELMKFGEEEVAALHERVLDLIKQQGLNMTFIEFSNHLRDDPKQKFTSKAEALDTYKRIIKTIADHVTKVLPADLITDEVLNVEVKDCECSALGYYNDESFWVGLEPLELKNRYEALALTLHEAVPGHHLQTVVAKNQKMPKFVRLPGTSRYLETPGAISFPSAYAEGWGLYSESLGFEMGLYEDDSTFGYYSYNLLRAARLVVDTGLHVYGWSRDRAVQYLLDNTAMSRRSVEQQVDRYISIPGQATTYKVGERNIKKMRARAESELGDQFDVREFNRVVITCVGPLSVLETCVDAWILSGGDAAVGSGVNLDYTFNDDISRGDRTHLAVVMIFLCSVFYTLLN